MKRGLLLLIFGMMSNSAVADWDPAETTEDSVIYINLETIHKVGNRAKMWELSEYKQVQKFIDREYWSSKQLVEYDCKTKQERTLSTANYVEHMGAGKSFFSSNINNADDAKWVAIGSDSVGETLWRAACGNRRISLSTCSSYTATMASEFPKSIDKFTTILGVDCVNGDKGVVLVYRNRFEGAKSQLPLHLIGLYGKQQLVGWCSDPQRKALLSSVDVRYSFVDRDGTYIGETTFQKKDCGKG